MRHPRRRRLCRCLHHPPEAGVSIMLSAGLLSWHIIPGSAAASAETTASGPTHAGGCLFASRDIQVEKPRCIVFVLANKNQGAPADSTTPPAGGCLNQGAPADSTTPPAGGCLSSKFGQRDCAGKLVARDINQGAPPADSPPADSTSASGFLVRIRSSGGDAVTVLDFHCLLFCFDAADTHSQGAASSWAADGWVDRSSWAAAGWVDWESSWAAAGWVDRSSWAAAGWVDRRSWSWRTPPEPAAQTPEPPATTPRRRLIGERTAPP